jgi:hypothetical protein
MDARIKSGHDIRDLSNALMRNLQLCLLALSLAATTASAQDRPIGFLTPSKNIVCQFFTDNAQGVLRCDLMEMDTRPRHSADCELDWGHAFEMTVKGSAGRICAGDSVMDASLPVLAYGEVWQRAGFTCRSEQTGLTCFNAMQHGFSLARAKQEVF